MLGKLPLLFPIRGTVAYEVHSCTVIDFPSLAGTSAKVKTVEACSRIELCQSPSIIH
jgi:hypothetical protein